MDDRIQILLIEDNNDQAELTRLHLQKNNIDVTHAKDAAQAMRLIGKKQFSTILLDYNLPEMTGLELIDKMKPIIQKTPIIFVTGAGNEKVAVQAMKKGVTDYIIKEDAYLKKLPKVIQYAAEKFRLEYLLAQSQERYSKLFQNANDAILIADCLNFKIIEANNKACEYFDANQEKLQKSALPELIDTMDRDRFSERLIKTQQTFTTQLEDVHLNQSKTTGCFADVTISMVQTVHGAVMQCIFRDTTERNQMQRQILRSKLRLQALFDGVQDMISVVNKNYEIVMVNQKYADWCGEKPEALIGKKCYHVLFGRDEPCEVCPVLESFKGGHALNIEREHADELLNITSSPMPGLEGDPELAIEHIRVITESKRLEQQLIQSEKLATVGILSSGIAHELRNPLNIIEAARFYLADTIPEEQEDIHKKLAMIRVNIQRSSKIIGNLLEFSRKSGGEKQETDLNYLLESTINLVEKELRHNSIIVRKNLLAPAVCIVNADGIRHVFLNLIMNAMYAMKEGGELYVGSEKKNGKVSITFSDTGNGIHKYDIKNIFTPFFTTKPIGEGTGLGLYIANSIVKNHKGKLEVDSTVDKGTTFTIQLPVENVEMEQVDVHQNIAAMQ